MKPLTKAEEEIMQVLWKLEKGFVKEIIDELPKPKPAYNTVSTIVRILEKKGFVDHEAFGKSYRYYPLISKSSYSNDSIKSLMQNYFGGSFEELVSFFVKKNDIDIAEAEKLIEEIKKNKPL
ncbi:MAG: BlaI/MecI/CopY family transcriptional regulator [Chitinophagales bacterium]